MRVVVVLFFIVTLSLAQKAEYISLGAYNSPSEATEALAKVDSNVLMNELAKRYTFEVGIQKMDQHYHIVISHFANKQDIPILYDVLQRDYLTIKSNFTKIEKSKRSQLVWFGLILGFIIFVVLFWTNRSAKRYNELEDQYNRVKNLKDRLNQRHDEVLNNLGYKIESSTRDMITQRDKIINQPFTEYNKKVVEERFKSIQDTDKILTDTTNQIIDFLQAKSGKLKLDIRRFDINRLLESVSTFISQNYKGKSVELIYDINVDVPRYIMGDFKRLKEILVNIIDYSFSTTSKGSVKLVISKFDATDEPILEFKILDSSMGLKPEQLSSIFAPFNNQNSNQGGLFIAKELIKLMKGKLDLFSRYGKGNTFAINLPLDVDKGSKQMYLLSTENNSQEELERKYIGVIEKDNEVANAIKKSFLHFIKNVTTVAHYSLDDYDVLNRFDLILIEHSMITSELLELFKKIQAQKDYHVIVMHSMLNSEYKEYIDNAINRYISKPLSPSHALKIFLDEYSSLKVVGSVDEVIFMERMEDNFHSHLPRQYSDPMPTTKDVNGDFLRDFYGTSLLFIEDDLNNQKSFTLMLNESGIRYALSQNSEMTMDQLSRYYNNFNMIIINYSVDRGRGPLIVKMIRSSRAHDKIPIVAIVEENEQIGELLKVGVNAYIIKPLEIGTLYTVLERFIDKVDLSSPLIKLSTSEHILDITRGIMQSQHNHAIYMKILEEFRDAYGESATQFEEYVKDQNYLKVKELVSNMKGLSDIMGANNMYLLLKEIESTLQRHKYSELEEFVINYHTEIENLKNNIEIYLRSMQS